MTGIHPPLPSSLRPGRRRAATRVGVLVAAVLVVAACGSGGDSTESAEPTVPADAPADDTPSEPAFKVVVSDPPIADLVSQVGGDGVEVISVVPLGADGHTYEPVPEDARTLAEADIYIENGIGMNDVVTAFALANYPQGTPHYELGLVVPTSELISSDSEEEIAAHGHAHDFNAHFWPDPIYAIAYVEEIAEILTRFDPDGADRYSERAAALIAQLQQMDAAFRTAVGSIPEANRTMVVYHDSWSYFGRRYGIPVLGAIQPTDFSEPSAAELRATIEEVRDAGVPAFFGSEVFPSDVLEVIEAESGATYVADLSDDRLPGEPGTPEHSYQGMMLQNVRTIVEALGGDASALDAIVLTAS